MRFSLIQSSRKSRADRSLNEKLISSLTDIVQNLSRSTIQNLGSFFGAVATIVLAVITMPFILFYLLKDGRKLAPYFVKFLPTKCASHHWSS